MAQSVNRVFLLGNLTRDAELRYTQANRPVLNFTVATNKAWQNKTTGEWEEAAEFHNCAMFGDYAQRVADRMTKGQRVHVEGEIQTRRWTGRDGQDRESKDILVHTVITMNRDGGQSRSSDDDPPQPERNDGPDIDDGMPF